MQQDNTESSVMVSLRELVALESDRVADEERERAAAERAAEAARRHAAEQQRLAEQARRSADEQRREAQVRRTAEEVARLKAIKDAEVARVRIEAQGRAERQMVEAQQHHEREMLTLSQSRQAKRLKATAWLGLAATLLLAVGGGVAWYNYDQQAQAQQRASELRLAEQQQELARKRLSGLDELHQQLLAQVKHLQPPTAEVASALGAIEQARARVASSKIGSRDLDDFSKSLTALAAVLPRAHRQQRLAILVDLHNKILQQMAKVRRPDEALTNAADSASELRKRAEINDPSDNALREYSAQVMALHAALPDSSDKPTIPRPSTKLPPVQTPTGPVCPKGDPLCSDILDGS